MESLIETNTNLIQLSNNAVTVTPQTTNQPYTIVPKDVIDVIDWAEDNREQLKEILLDQGAILLRGFDIGSAQKFNALFSTLCGKAMEYKNRTSPRNRVHENVYTSTSHPSDQTIHMHTENSYSNTFNRIIAFYCLTPPREGGETPIADERKLLSSLRKGTIKKFRDKGVKYVRNIFPGIGLDWKTIYQTDSKEIVNEKIKALGHEFSWVDPEHLRVSWSLPAFQKHPIKNKDMWFNHMYFGHKSLYDPAILEFFPEDSLPFATYYGDGTEIEPEVIEEFQEFYQNNSLVYKWQKDDFLLLDNMMYSHGRSPFLGDRTILTAMGEPREISLT